MTFYESQSFRVTLLFALLLVLNPAIAGNCTGRKRTLELCRRSSECDPELACIDKDKHVGCTTMSKFCKCQTAGLVYCPASACARGEVCAKVSSKTSAPPSYCVSCKAIKSPLPTRTIAPLNKDHCKMSPALLPTPPKALGPARRAYDFCSVFDPCANGLVCLDTENNSKSVRCKAQSIGCRCYTWNRSAEACLSPNDCKRPQETCMKSTLTGKAFCCSCNLIKTNPFFIEVSASKVSKCGQQAGRPPPQFVPSAGLSYDSCSPEIPCRKDKGYTCMFNDIARFKSRRCTENTSFDG